MIKRLVLIITIFLFIPMSIKACIQKDAGTIIEYELNEEGIIKPEFAKQIIQEISDEVLISIRNKDMDTLSTNVHPKKGVRFTPYTNVSIERDVVFTKDQIKNFFKDQSLLNWGYYDGIGTEIILTPSDYYHMFIYTKDFINADEVGYNEVLSSGNIFENQFEVYNTPIIVEYYFPNFDPEFLGMDWKSLRLVFEEYEGKWMLVGIIHNQSTS